MKITRRVGLSYYTLEFNKEETAQWKATSNLPKFLKKNARHDIFLSAYTRIKFGSVDGFLKRLQSLENDLKKLNF